MTDQVAEKVCRWHAQPIEDHLRWQASMQRRVEAERALVRHYALPIVQKMYAGLLDRFVADFLADFLDPLDPLDRWADDGGSMASAAP